MATVYSTLASSDFRPSNKQDGKSTTPVAVFPEPAYTTVSTTADGDVINLLHLNKGDKVEPIGSWVVSDADVAATSATVTIGLNGDADALSTALDVNAAGRDQFALNGTVEATADGWLTATLAIAGAVTVGTTLTFKPKVILS